jgi:hypothetical protein
MGGKKLATDELAARAKANGYKKGEHQEEGQPCDNYRHVDKTKKDQDGALDR